MEFPVVSKEMFLLSSFISIPGGIFSSTSWISICSSCYRFSIAFKSGLIDSHGINVNKGIDYPKSSNFPIMLKIKLYVCRNLCENFRQIGQKMKKL